MYVGDGVVGWMGWPCWPWWCWLGRLNVCVCVDETNKQRVWVLAYNLSVYFAMYVCVPSTIINRNDPSSIYTRESDHSDFADFSRFRSLFCLADWSDAP